MKRSVLLWCGMCAHFAFIRLCYSWQQSFFTGELENEPTHKNYVAFRPKIKEGKKLWNLRSISLSPTALELFTFTSSHKSDFHSGSEPPFAVARRGGESRVFINKLSRDARSHSGSDEDVDISHLIYDRPSRDTMPITYESNCMSRKIKNYVEMKLWWWLAWIASCE